MVMLPRNITSPMVSPSAGTGCIVSGSSTRHALLQVVMHALPRVQAGAFAHIQTASHSACFTHTAAGP
jgi:hypothetical protein